MSPNQLRSQLVNACSSSSQDLPELWRGYIHLQLQKLRMVESVERLQPELEAQPLCNRKVLEQGKIEIIDARRSQDVSARVARDAWCRLRERGFVKPRVNRACSPAAGLADEVRAVRSEAVEDAARISRRDRDRKSPLKSGDAIDLPAPDHRIGCFVKTASKTLTPPEG